MKFLPILFIGHLKIKVNYKNTTSPKIRQEVFDKKAKFFQND